MSCARPPARRRTRARRGARCRPSRRAASSLLSLPGETVVEQLAKAFELGGVELPIAHELGEQQLGRAGEDLVENARQGALAGEVGRDRRQIAVRLSFG